MSTGAKGTRVSEFYALGRSQAELDFVDVDVERDLPVFIDPRALRRLPGAWGQECVVLVQDFFGTVIDHIRQGRHSQARGLLSGLSEPNDTRLGFSKGRAQGRAVGHGFAGKLCDALSKSEAVTTGLLVDLEETALMVEGIDADVVSDMATNIMRERLIAYTAERCAYYGIPSVSDVASGRLWDPGQKEWHTRYVALPVPAGRPLVLVPKAIVRRRLEYDPGEYYQHYILEQLQTEELNAKGELVKLLKDGRSVVYKKDLIKKHGYSKRVSAAVTMRETGVLKRYRADKKKEPAPPLSLNELLAVEEAPPYNWDGALSAVVSLSVGTADADAYVDAVQRLMEALFYPALVTPSKEVRIHEGRKRIDITFTNMAEGEFFKWLAAHYPSAMVMVECKNYTADPGNPELDQLAGRFSPSRGQVGLLVCRRLEDRALFEKRCIDTAHDQRGFIIALDDEDLRALVKMRKDGDQKAFEAFMRERFNRLIMA